MDLADLPVRDIAVSRPGATAVFRRYKIDYCCGGEAPLSAAVDRRGANLEAILAELGALAAAEPDTPATTPELIEHILERYHETHRRQFPEAIRLARRVEAVHGERPECPVGLSHHLTFMFDDLETHHQKEEMALFPMMLAGRRDGMDAPIACMADEHKDVLEQLTGLARITGDFAPPEGACTTWRALFELCRQIDADLREHMHLENNVLFPAFA